MTTDLLIIGTALTPTSPDALATLTVGTSLHPHVRAIRLLTPRTATSRLWGGSPAGSRERVAEHWGRLYPSRLRSVTRHFPLQLLTTDDGTTIAPMTADIPHVPGMCAPRGDDIPHRPGIPAVRVWLAFEGVTAPAVVRGSGRVVIPRKVHRGEWRGEVVSTADVASGDVLALRCSEDAGFGEVFSPWRFAVVA